MPLGYKYAERDADSYVDWSAVGKNLSDALAKEAQDRRDKIQEFEDQDIIDVDVLNNAPQGKYKPANEFTNNFAHDAKEMSLINKRLRETGQMSPRQYTLSRQNLMNGTQQIFDLQKTYQKEFDEVMEGVQSGDLQALNIAFMSMVEQFGDFTKSKGIINPLDCTVNIGMMAPNPKTGVMELTKDVMPVSVAMGKLTTRVKTFMVDDEINKSIAAFGDRKEAIYDAANIVKAGTITELTGIGALEKYPQFKNTIVEFNKAVDGTIASYFAGNKYNLTSVLTQNVGGYNDASFIYDRDQADKDPSKILLKIDPNTKLPVMDESAPHFAEQNKKAEDWVRTQIMNRLDSERKIGTTSQLNELQPKRAMTEREWDEKDRRDLASNVAEQIANVVSGNPAQVQSALNYFKAKKVDINRFADRIEISQPIYDKNGKPTGKTEKIPYYFTKGGKIANPIEFGKSLISGVDADGVGENYIADQLASKFKRVGSTINTKTTGSGGARKRNTKVEFANKANKELVTSDLFLKKDKFDAIDELKKRLSGVPGLTIESVPSKMYTITGGLKGNEIILKYGTESVTIDSYKKDKNGAYKQKNNVIDFLKKLPEDVQDQILGPDPTEQQLRTKEEQGKGELD
jgi:hypothetical protein